MAKADKDHLHDCETLSAIELRQRYRSEANTHRNMLSRAKAQGKVVDPEFRNFQNFLRCVGPQPCLGATLDRIDNRDPVYGPGKVRWADKRTQNNNKGDTLVFHRSGTRVNYTASRLAKLQKVDPSTIRKRHERGWTDDEVIRGTRSGSEKAEQRMLSPDLRPTIDERGRRVPSPYSRDARDIMWHRREATANYYRKVEGAEWCIAHPEEIREILELGPDFEFSMRRFRIEFWEWWKEYEVHLFREKFPQWAQDLIVDLEAEHARTQ